MWDFSDRSYGRRDVQTYELIGINGFENLGGDERKNHDRSETVPRILRG